MAHIEHMYGILQENSAVTTKIELNRTEYHNETVFKAKPHTPDNGTI